MALCFVEQHLGKVDMQVLLTGDRPSGRLHLGHYVGSLQNRVALQRECVAYVLIADIQALTDNFETPQLVTESVYGVATDYLAVGIDPEVATVCVQSQVREIAELTMYFMNLVTLARLQRNPTVKAELLQKGLEESLPVGFLCYPINQAADITVFGADIVPVGEDQLPMIEQTNEIVRRFNRIYGAGEEILKECSALVGKTGRLPGIDGKGKASKSLKNAIFLLDERDVVKEKVFAMYTDPNHVRASDPGKIEGNVVFAYLDIFHNDKDELELLKSTYRNGGLGDVQLKSILFDDLEKVLAPFRARGKEINRKIVKEVLVSGTARAQQVARQTLEKVREVIGVTYANCF
jgi:tryptophanyl-tRNA synthetase